MGRIIPEGMMREICDSMFKFRILFGITAAVIGLMLIWYPFSTPGGATRVVIVLNIVLASPFVVLSTGFIYLCRKRQERAKKAGERPDGSR
jgi:cytochrome bd-type quinol oxidase subunit 1